MMRAHCSLPKVSLVLATLCAVAPLPAADAGFEERVSLSADRLVLRNVIGRIEVQGHAGSAFEVELRITGDDATRERVTIDRREGKDAAIEVRFPVDESRSYVCPHSGGKSSFDASSDGSWLGRLLGKGRLSVSDRGDGLAICADALVRVPAGKSLVVEHGVGPVVATDVAGNLTLSTHAGHVEARGIAGALAIDTGSGSVQVADVGGDTLVDTGSGSVHVSAVRGSKLHIDTGSGSVEIEDFDGANLHVDTGSGSVEAAAIGADELSIDTGSGAVALTLSRMGAGRFIVDTGSGSIDVQLPAGASVKGRADTGAGGVQLDLADAQVARVDGGEAEFTLGDGAARLALDSGGGRIRVHH
jgi:predicted aspartyl protease